VCPIQLADLPAPAHRGDVRSPVDERERTHAAITSLGGLAGRWRAAWGLAHGSPGARDVIERA